MRTSIFFDISSELFFVVDIKKLKFEYVNKNVAELLGYTSEYLTSNDFLNFVHPDDRKRTLDFIQGGKDIVFPFTNRYMNSKGESVFIRWLNCKKDKGNTDLYYLNAVDITDLNEALIVSQDLAEENQRTKEELKTLLSLLAHDLKAPLKHISVFLSILREEETDLKEESRDLVVRSIKSCAYAGSIVDGVNLLSKVSAISTFEKVNLQDILHKCLDNISEKIKYTNAEVVVQGELPEIVGNKFSIEHVLINVISNSLKFVPDGVTPVIYIGHEKDNCIYVKDNGIGVAEEDLTNIFNMFVRVSQHKYSGSGIGLGIVKKIMDAHHGSVWARNGINGGLEVYLDFNHVQPT